MRQAPEKMRQLLEPVVEGLGYECVGIVYLAQGHDGLLRIYIDRPEGVTVEDCGRVSHQVSGVLDVEDPIDGHYTLEVSSPGIDRPLFRREDFARFAGHPVKLRTARKHDGRSRFSGTLRGITEDEVMLEVEGAELRLPYEDIDQAHLVGNSRPGGSQPGEPKG